MLTCGSPVRAEAPEAMTHNEVANFENLSVEALRKKIVERYMLQLLLIVEIRN